VDDAREPRLLAGLGVTGILLRSNLADRGDPRLDAEREGSSSVRATCDQDAADLTDCANEKRLLAEVVDAGEPIGVGGMGQSLMRGGVCRRLSGTLVRRGGLEGTFSGD